MKLLEFFQYIYLFFAVFFIYQAITTWGEGNQPYISLALAALSIFMFFFRRKFRKKFDDRNNNQ